MAESGTIERRQANRAGKYAVYRYGEYPHKKRDFYPNTFEKRQHTLNFCRAKQALGNTGLTIVHPDGTHESYVEVLQSIAINGIE